MQNNISYLYNPASQTEQELIEGFVARKQEFKRIMRDIKHSKLNELSQNFLITAQRGMGKTTLLLRLEYEIKAMPELSHLIPIRFTEEQYNIVSFCNLWEVVADTLDELDRFKGIVEQLENSIDEDVESCFEVIKKALQKNEKKILLLVDNFQDILRKFTDNEVKELRDILHGSELQLISASSIAIEDTYRHDKPFFEFFKSIQLEGLNTTESQELFKKLAQKHPKGMQNYNASRIEIVKRLTGGVPRTMIIIFEIFLDRNAEIFENLEYILDQVTPLYKHRMDDLTPQQQRVAHEIAIAWDGISFDELKKKTRTDEEELRGYLLELEKAYFIDVRSVGTTVDIYLLKERFFNIWYLMRHGRTKNKEHIKWLIKFLEIWFDSTQLKDKAYSHIQMLHDGKINSKGALLMGEALSEIIDDEILQYNLQIETKLFFERYNLVGINYHNKGDYDKAIEFYQKVVELNPENNFVYRNIGLSYNSKGDYDKAIEFYQKAIKLNPKYEEAHYSIGFSYNSKGDYNKAIEFYKKVIELNPKYEKAYHSIGYNYYIRGIYDKAVGILEKAIELNFNNSGIYNLLAWVYYCQSLKKKKSLVLIAKSIELERNICNLHTYSTILLWNSKYDISLKIIKEILEPDNYLLCGGYLKFAKYMTDYFLLLIAKQQTQSLDKLFKEYPNLKNEFKPVYYTLMYFMQDEYPTEYQRMGAELEETVQEMVDEVGKLREKYGEDS